MKKKSSVLQQEGILFEEFIAYDGMMGMIMQRGGDDFTVSLSIESPAIFFSRCHSIFSFSLKNSNSFFLDVYSTLLLPANSTLQIEAISKNSEFVLLMPNKQLFNKVSKLYNIHSRDFNEVFLGLKKLPRSNWINEIMHRYTFERIVAKNSANEACSFLESEILKEVYFLYKEQNIAFKNRFNLDALNLDQKGALTQKALLFIEENLFQNFSMKKLCQELACTESTLLRAFSKDLKQSPFNYLKNRRLEEAYILLKGQHFSVGEVAFKIGHEDVSAFISAFKRKFGFTPAKLLNNH